MSYVQALLFSKLTLSCVVAFLVTIGCVGLVKPIAAKMDLQDLPGGRKQHKQPTPIIGGICMFIGFCFALLTLAHSLQDYRGFLAASALLIFVGVLDDMHELSTKARFIAQIMASLLMIFWGHNLIRNFGDLVFLGNISLGYLAIPVTVFATVGSINSINMMDGVDGLLGTVALVQFTFLAWLATRLAESTSFAMMVLVMGSITAYLVFNFPFRKNKYAIIFMGDAGSMFLGFALTWFLISLSQHNPSLVAPVTMLWIFAVPLFDTTWLLIKRTRHGKNPLAPNRDHLHHLMQRAGISDRNICLLIGAASLMLGFVGIAAMKLHIDQGTQFFGFLFIFILYCLALNLSWDFFAKQNRMTQPDM